MGSIAGLHGANYRPVVSIDASIIPLQMLGLGGFSDIGGIKLCMQILAIYPFASLRTICIRSQSEVVPPESDEFIDHISPLLLLSSLQHVELFLPNHTFALFDEHVFRMGYCWPHIVDLLVHFTALEKSPFPDTYCVRELLCLCPHLRTLELPVMEITDTGDNLARQDWPDSDLDCLIIDKLRTHRDLLAADVDDAMYAAFPTLVPCNIVYAP